MVDLCGFCQDDRHGVGVNRRNDPRWPPSSGTEEFMHALDWRALGASPGRPEAGDAKERPILAQGKPCCNAAQAPPLDGTPQSLALERLSAKLRFSRLA